MNAIEAKKSMWSYLCVFEKTELILFMQSISNTAIGQAILRVGFKPP